MNINYIKKILLLTSLFIMIGYTAIAQYETDRFSFGLGLDCDMIVRSDDLDQEGIGSAFAIGGIRHLGEGDRLRLTGSLEYGSFKWEEDRSYNDYYALNLLLQFDLIRKGKYALPLGGGLVLDYSQNVSGDSRIKPAYRLSVGNRLTFKKNWALEFFSFGYSYNRGFIVLRCNYLRLEKHF